MKDDNLSDDKSSLQASVLIFFILSTKSYSIILSNLQYRQYRSGGAVQKVGKGGGGGRRLGLEMIGGVGVFDKEYPVNCKGCAS